MFEQFSFSSLPIRWFSSMNWHKLRVGQLDAPTVRLIRKASQKPHAEFVYYTVKCGYCVV